MTSSDLLAFGDAGRALLRTIETGRIAPSYLFEGADPGDLREAALAFAAGLLSSGHDENQAHRALLRAQAGQHPDLHVLERDKPTVISVAALAAELERAHQTPIEGRWQVFLIDPAEAMEAEGVARYLKALEEPPAGAVFVLVSTRPDRLPATVLSRVCRVRLPPVPPERVEARLEEEGVAPSDAMQVARWSGGSIARARRLLELDAASHVDALLNALSDGGGAARVTDRVLAALERQAGTDTEGGSTGDRRERIRRFLRDLLYALAIECRDRAADRPTSRLVASSADEALIRLRDVGMLQAAVAANVSPHVVLLEIVRRFAPTPP